MHEEKYITHTKGHCITEVGTEMSLPERRYMDQIIAWILSVIIAAASFTAEPKPAYTQDDINLLAEVIYWENWHTDSEHLAAYYTGAVVMNRVKSQDWPNTIESVLYQKGQYSTTKYFFTEEIPAEVYEMAERILRDGTDDVPEGVIFQSMRPLGKVWKKVNTDYFCFE